MVSNHNNSVSNLNFVFLNILANFVLDDALLVFDIIETFFDFLLEGAFEVKLIDGVERDHRVR